MLSKCANPECSEIFRYLHLGKIFYLAPTPEIELASGLPNPELHERFWLCERCSHEMTLSWDGTQVKMVRISIQAAEAPLRPPPNKMGGRRSRTPAASADRDDVATIAVRRHV